MIIPLIFLIILYYISLDEKIEFGFLVSLKSIISNENDTLNVGFGFSMLFIIRSSGIFFIALIASLDINS